MYDTTIGWLALLLNWFITAFIVLPLHSKHLVKNCKKDCTKCKLWHCEKWHNVEVKK